MICTLYPYHSWVLFLLLRYSRMMCANNPVHYGPVVVFVFDCALRYLIIIIMQTCLKILNFKNTCQVHSVECVSKIESIIWIIFHSIYAAVCIELTHVSYGDANTCTLSCYHYRIGSIHLSLLRVFGHETMVCALCIFITQNKRLHSHFSHNRRTNNRKLLRMQW